MPIRKGKRTLPRGTHINNVSFARQLAEPPVSEGNNKEVDMTNHVDYDNLAAHEAVAMVTVAVLSVANGVLIAFNTGIAVFA